MFTYCKIQRLEFGGLQLSSASKSKIVKQSESTMNSSSDVQFYLEVRLGLDDAGAQQGSPTHYSCVGVNSHKSCMD